jgi:hypothetical protein
MQWADLSTVRAKDDPVEMPAFGVEIDADDITVDGLKFHAAPTAPRSVIVLSQS